MTNNLNYKTVLGILVFSAMFIWTIISLFKNYKRGKGIGWSIVFCMLQGALLAYFIYEHKDELFS